MDPFEFEEPKRNLRQFLDESKVKCSCGEKLCHAQMQSHSVDCQSQKFVCPNSCGAELTLSVKESHWEACPMRLKQCQDCFKAIREVDAAEHDCVKELLRLFDA